MQIVRIIITIMFTLAAYAGEVPTNDVERAQATAFEMQSWRIALVARQKDQRAFPAGDIAAAKAAVEPVYINRAALYDAWGNPFHYEGTDGGFLLVSAGADGKFDRASWSRGGELKSLDDDAVMTATGLSRSWDAR